MAPYLGQFSSLEQHERHAYCEQDGSPRLVEYAGVTQLTSVEQTSSGAVACQVLDVLYPGKLFMNYVDWTATQPYECLHNYKLLQQIFLALHIDKQIAVDKLISEQTKITAMLEKMENMKIETAGLAEEKIALEVELHALREKVRLQSTSVGLLLKCLMVAQAERIKDKRVFYINRLETIAELVHDAELSKTTSAQTNLLGLSILDILYATEGRDAEK
ncbi:hypothetical protein PInf_018590 [Phytophthora infestans]|nr:hypothetical protein PInf_018590 [Phytophthora infestans]